MTDKNTKETPLEPEELYADLIGMLKLYHPSGDFSMIEKAYKLADTAHKGQVRKSGEPYIIHPLCVAMILCELEMDKETICAGLLHDVVEDTEYGLNYIAKEFGEDVAQLVDGVTKLGQLNYDADKLELQAENLRKMFLAMAKDIRVIIIKLADRLHNMRTLKYMKPSKQLEKARETMDIYAPIAQRLGIAKVKIELDDLSLKYLEPEVYKDLGQKIELRKAERQEFVNEICQDLRDTLEADGVKCEIYGRAKHFFSIYKKMINQNKTLDQIYDLFAIRIVVKDVKDCYAVLGIIHEMYKPIPGRFKDYIAMPKQNMYQSLHTTLISKTGRPFEIQIRTEEMHKTAEYGIAAHWKYKEASDGKTADQQEEAKLSWLRQILEWQRDMSDNKEFMNLIKSDLNLFSDSVYCFTPNGDVKNLPKGSTPIDFAYSIHSAVGNRMIGAKVNGKLVNIDYTLQNGDRVEVLTSQNTKGPSRDWLKIVKSSQARSKINQWFRNEFKEENIEKGKEMLTAYCKSKAVPYSEITKPEYTQRVMKKYGFHDWDAVLAAVGHGGLKEGQVINKIIEEYKVQNAKPVTDQDILNENADAQVKTKETKSKGGITVKGIHDVAVRFSKCCNPVPGDEIVGFVTRGRGVSIHRTDCVNVINMTDFDRGRLIEADWEPEDIKGGETFLTEINIYGNNRVGLLVDITKIFTEQKIDIHSINSRTSKQGIATVSLSFGVDSTESLRHLVDKIRQVESVIDVERTSG